MWGTDLNRQNFSICRWLNFLFEAKTIPASAVAAAHNKKCIEFPIKCLHLFLLKINICCLVLEWDINGQKTQVKWWMKLFIFPTQANRYYLQYDDQRWWLPCWVSDVRSEWLLSSSWLLSLSLKPGTRDDRGTVQGYSSHYPEQNQITPTLQLYQNALGWHGDYGSPLVWPSTPDTRRVPHFCLNDTCNVCHVTKDF